MNNVQENIKAWLDGELDTAQSQQVSEAIANDPEIAKMADFYQLLSDEIRTVAVQPEVHGASKILEMVHGKKSWWQSLGKLRFGVVGLGLISALALSTLLLPQGREFGQNTSSKVTFDSVPIPSSSAAPPQSPGESNHQSLKGIQGFEEAKKREISQSAMDSAPWGGSRPENRDLYNQTQSKSGMTTSEAHKYMRPKLKRSSVLSMQVKDARQAREEAERSIKVVDGFILNASTSVEGDYTVVSIKAKVPEESFEKTMETLRGYGVVMSENTTGEDITAQVVESRTYVEQLADEEANLVKRLNATKSEVQKQMLRNEIRQVRMQLASWKAQAKVLTEMAEYSQINLTLKQPSQGPIGSSAEDTWSNSVAGLQKAGSAMLKFVIVLLVYSPIWLPVALISVLVYRKTKSA